MAANKDDLVAKYKARLEAEFNAKVKESPSSPKTSNYTAFRDELLPSQFSRYEKLCNFSEKVVKISPDKKSSEDLNANIDLCHLNVTPTGVYSAAVLCALVCFVVLGLVFFVIFQSVVLLAFALLISVILMFSLMKLPEFYANSWRMKASNQMVQAIFYVATYMRHTSNLELGIRFAADHLAPPLSIDMKKVLWDVETNRYGSIQESLDNYLETWKKWNTEFIESFHLIESSLLETSEDRRLTVVDKALNVMLDETYEKMLRYAHELKAPITMLYMLGIILPILGLVILPLVASFMTNGTSPIKLALYIALFYNVTMPIGIFYLGKVALSKRPTGYGETDISEQNPEIKKYKNVVVRLGGYEAQVNPLWISAVVFASLLLIGLIPLSARLFVNDQSLLCEQPFEANLKLLDYRKDPISGSSSFESSAPSKMKLVGPYGFGAGILSLFVTLAFGLSVGIYYRLRSSKIIKIRENTKKLEDEFASALFQLGNRLGDGLPAEIAFAKVATVTKGSVTGEFFEMVSSSISRAGMGLKQAIFDPVRGALIYFPSSLIESSMKVLIESSKKGPLIASQALINVSEYIKQIHRVNERLKDLMADIISDMKQQTNILAPAIAGIVVGITSMIVTILGSLADTIAKIQETGGDTASGQAATFQTVVNLFGQGIPTYYFQIIVGIYVVEIVFILTILTNGIENGSDKLGEQYALGNNMIKSTVIYCIIALVVIVMFNFIASTILSGAIDQSISGAGVQISKACGG